MKKLFLVLAIIFSATSFAKITPSDYIFAVVKSEDSILVFVNVKSHWEAEKSLIDSYRSEEENDYVTNSMLKADLCNSMESTFEPCKRAYKKSEYVQMLKSFGWEHNTEFEKWMNSQI